MSSNPTPTSLLSTRLEVRSAEVEERALDPKYDRTAVRDRLKVQIERMGCVFVRY